MLRTWLLVILSVLMSKSGSLASIKARFEVTFKSEAVNFGNKFYALNASDSIAFDAFKCYLSGFRFYKNGKLVAEEPASYHLCDVEQLSSLEFEINVGEIDFNEMDFNLGIDSATNATGIHGGSLDPTKGMYWAWQSGYINFKLEGRSNVCATRLNEFQLHVGGFLQPYSALQLLKFTNITGPQNRIAIKLKLDDFIDRIELHKQPEIMEPGPKAVKASKLLATCISVSVW